MSFLIFYLIKAGLASAAVYLIYLIFFRRDTFYVRNRIFLLSSMIIPPVLPFIQLSRPEIIGANQGSIFIFSLPLSLDNSYQGGAFSGLRDLNISDILLWIWIVVAVILLLRMVSGVFAAIRIISAGRPAIVSSCHVYLSDKDHPPFSFWNAIVIPVKMSGRDEMRDIIMHEKAHRDQLHTLDLLISEIFISFFWFSPVSWMIKKSLVLNHEYYADLAALGDSDNVSEYQFRLLNMPALFSNNRLVHNFQSNIKNRIIMMNKKPTLNIAALKNLVILPAMLILFLFVSFKPVNEIISDPQDVKPLFSKESQEKLMQYMYQNIRYPEKAKENGITGRFYVIVRMGKGGKVIGVSIDEKYKSINVPLLSPDEIVVVGYGTPSAFTPITNEPESDFASLKNEGIRIGRSLGSLDLPEWKNKGMTFGFSMNFQLREESSDSQVRIRATGNNSGLDPLVIVDGKEVPAGEIKNISPSSILSINVLKDESAFKKYGEKGKNGVIEITLK